MRTPLRDALTTTEGALPEGDAGRQLAVLFEAAEGRENQYAADRLRDVYQLAERSMVLGRETALREAPVVRDRAGWAPKAASVAAGVLLAACAPIVASTSVLLAAACGVAAAGALLLPLRPDSLKPASSKQTALPPQDKAEAKLAGVVAAADRALQAMVEPQRLAPPAPPAARPDEDVLGLLQDALMLGRGEPSPAEREVAENADRLARRMGYTPTYEGEEAAFEVMIDPGVEAPVLLRPALVHADPARTVPGVRVRG